jgi:hypothetical protein
MMLINKTIILLFFFIGLIGCKKFILVDAPTSNITQASVFNNDLTAIAVLTGIYSNISDRGLSSNLLTLSKLGALSADELDLWSGASDVEKAYYQNALQTNMGASAGLSAGVEIWNACYKYIYDCNQAIEGINNSSILSGKVKQQLLGEAKFLRSFFYFYLTNLYGDLPIVTTTYYDVNRQLSRSSQAEVYDLIVSDLKDAQSALSSSYLNSDLNPYSTNPERVRPTNWAATALLARVYLYRGEYALSETESSKVISNKTLFSLPALSNVFLKNSSEAIWQLQPVSTGWNTVDAQWFVLTDPPQGFSTTKSVYLNSSLYNSFESGDNRKIYWTGVYTSLNPSGTYYFSYKYRNATQNSTITAPNNLTEYHMILRLAEQYLIRAEARAKQGNISGAIDDLNLIRDRARATPSVSIPNPLPPLSATMIQSQVLNAVLKERRVELFTEFGHRWLDLKRTASVDSIMSIVTPLKGGTWQSSDQFYPIPVEDIFRNPNLKQNSGYE